MSFTPSQHAEVGSNPKKILDLNYAFAQTAILIAAVRLHFFSLIREHTVPIEMLAKEAGTDLGATRRLLEGLGTLGLVEQTEEGYLLTSLAQHFLVEGKASYLGGDTLAMMDYIPAWLALDQTLQSAMPYRDLGSPAVAEAFFTPRVRDLFPLIYPIAMRAAPLLVAPETNNSTLYALDLGAGCAPWSAALAHLIPSVHVTAIDLPEVARQGQRYIDELELGAQFTWQGADIEQIDYAPDTFDIIFLGHVSRFISDERVISLFNKLFKSLRPEGKLLLADVFFVDGLRNPAAVMLDLSMLVNTAQGRIRSCNEVEVWLYDNGFANVQRIESIGPFPVLIAQKEGVKYA